MYVGQANVWPMLCYAKHPHKSVCTRVIVAIAGLTVTGMWEQEPEGGQILTACPVTTG